VRSDLELSLGTSSVRAVTVCPFEIWWNRFIPWLIL